jgi:hypothetical protein
MAELLDVLRLVVAQIERVPAVAWAGVLIFAGAVIVWRTNAQSTRRLRMQLDAEEERLRLQLQETAHRQSEQLKGDSSERRTERAAAMRREAYFDALGEIGAASFLLVSLPNTDPANGDSRLLDPLLKALSRVGLVAEDSGRALAARLTGQYLDAMRVAMKARQPAAEAKAALDVSKKAAEYLTDQREAITRKKGVLLDLKPSEFASPENQSALAWYDKSINDLTKRLTDANEELIARIRDRGAAGVAAVDTVAEAMSPLRATLRELELALRVELGFGVEPPPAAVDETEAWPGLRS